MRVSTRRSLCIIVSLFLAVVSGSPGEAQTGEQPRVRVFLDCQSQNCDSREFRTEIGFVDWVSERTAADVHLLMTSQSAGAGAQYVLDFIGQNEFEELSNRLEYTSSNSDTRDETLSSLTGLLEAGLVAFVARRGYANLLNIQAISLVEEAGPAGEQIRDPWNLWVFGVGAEFSADGEERQNSREFSFDLDANRTTDDWKFDARMEVELFRREVELNNGNTFVDNSDDWEATALLVRSITNHISIGSELDANSSTNRNRDRGGRVASAVEWSLYPYAEANRRQLVIHHQIGLTDVNYEEVTIFNRLEETYADQRIGVAYDTRQPWGVVSGRGQFSNLLHDFSKYSYSFGGGLNLRIVRGLDLRVNGNYEVLHDQIYLPAEGITDEEILVQRRQLATGYEYNIGVGFGFQFGSIFNNVVNNRFPGSVRGGGGGGGGRRFN